MIALVHALLDAGEAATEHPLVEGLDLVNAAIDAAVDATGTFADDGPLLRFVARLTLAPRTHRAAHLRPLRRAGYDDTALHDIVNVVCCFSYMNRLADGLGVALHTPERLTWAERLMGAERLARHRAWAAGDEVR